MNRSRNFLTAMLTLGLVALVVDVPAQNPGGAVNLEKIKYADLGKLVRSLKGKVLLVDFWAEY